MQYVYGIDVGGTSVKIGLFEASGNLIKKWEIPTDKTDDGKHILNDIYKSIINETSDLDSVIGYGFGVPGPVINNFTPQCVNLGWKDYDLALEFSQLVQNSNVIVKNDANVAALGELFKGAAIGKKDVVMITLGTGVGGGIIANGEVVDGAFGGGGEIGHVIVNHDKDAFLCNCGSSGCLETIASATGIKREFIAMSNKTHLISSIKDSEEASAKRIFEEAKAGDELCNLVIDKVSFYIGYACHMMSVITNPDMIVIGGGVSKAGNFLLDKVIQDFRKYKFIAALKTEIKLATLGNDAGMYGAASLIIND